MRADSTRDEDVLDMNGVYGHLHVNTRVNLSEVFSSVHVSSCGERSSPCMDTDV